MDGRQTRSGFGETAVCHACDRRFSTQADLLEHLREQHPDDLLPDPANP